MAEATTPNAALADETVERFRPLRWYKSTDHPQDCGDLTAHGWGGRYSIEPDLDKFIVWMAHDEFTYRTGATVDECKAIAEQHYRETIASLLKTPKETGQANCWVPTALRQPSSVSNEVVRTAAAFVAKLDECQPYIDTAFFHMHNHGMPHTGPQYGQELEALRQALAALPLDEVSDETSRS